MELTKEEQALIQAYREGADISVYFHSCKSVDEAVGCVNAFGDVKRIVDLSDENRTVVVFKNRNFYITNGLKVNAVLDYWKE